MILRNTLAALFRGRTAPLFQALEVEISSPCNMRCDTCPNKDHQRPVAELPLDVLVGMVEELKEIGYEGDFSPHFYNEPLMDSRLIDILTLVRNELPKVTINLFTNFTLMTTDLYRKLMPVVDEFVVTVDEPVVLKRVKRISEELTETERSKLRIRSIADVGLSNRAGAIDLNGDAGVQPESCGFVEYMVVDANGDAHLCCNDYFGKAVFGNVKEQAITEIWFSEAYVHAREKASKLKHPLCKGCFWTSPESL